ncbi:glycosyltransferase family 2 protein [Marinobacter sp.]|uniref:glycosyltransferase family 2 protein n=1 Tax=Marinobacter sp. TaxID=50741 RepID=UPI002B277F86|nr:glycosyltransferase family 2 protein [Marinobacter sp.]
MENPLVTVVIPAYNAEQYIEETLRSVLSQSYQNLEIIVVDDGSTDSTAAIVKSFGQQVRYLYQRNSGSCAAPRNHGLKKANGEFITFFDADDIMLPEKIASQVQILTTTPEAEACITNYRNFGGSKTWKDHFSSCPKLSQLIADTKQRPLVLPSEQCRSLLIDENFNSACSPLFRTNRLKKLKGFDETLKACEDFYLFYRTAIEGPVAIDTLVGFERRLHDLNMSSDNERMLKNFIQSRSQLIHLEPLPALKLRLRQRVTRYQRDLQTCLVNKRQNKPAILVYKNTFPPRSFSDLNHDLRQAIKMVIQGIQDALR